MSSNLDTPHIVLLWLVVQRVWEKKELQPERAAVGEMSTGRARFQLRQKGKENGLKIDEINNPFFNSYISKHVITGGKKANLSRSTMISTAGQTWQSLDEPLPQIPGSQLDEPGAFWLLAVILDHFFFSC